MENYKDPAGRRASATPPKEAEMGREPPEMEQTRQTEAETSRYSPRRYSSPTNQRNVTKEEAETARPVKEAPTKKDPFDEPDSVRRNREAARRRMYRGVRRRDRQEYAKFLALSLLTGILTLFLLFYRELLDAFPELWAKMVKETEIADTFLLVMLVIMELLGVFLMFPALELDPDSPIWKWILAVALFFFGGIYLGISLEGARLPISEVAKWVSVGYFAVITGVYVNRLSRIRRRAYRW